jgi:hypothetical protein
MTMMMTTNYIIYDVTDNNLHLSQKSKFKIISSRVMLR